MPGAEAPLAGKHVLVTRPSGRAAGLRKRLEARGARVTQQPTIAFAPPDDPEPPKRMLREIATFDWIVFTSVTAVQRFFDLCTRESVRPPEDARYAAVGAATARELEARGAVADAVAADSRSEGLAAVLRRRIDKGSRVLWPGPQTAREPLIAALSELGAVVERVALYRTAAAEGLDRLAEELRRGVFDAVVFGSPSAFERLASAAPEVRATLAGTGVVALGRTTRRALELAGVRCDATAAEPSDEAVAEAVAALFGATDAVLRSRVFPPDSAPRGGIVQEVGVKDAAELRQTPLHAAHVAAGARIVDFSGWSMPVQYSGVIDEHQTVRTRVGLFDVSHMGEATVRGPQALDFLQRVTCNNVAKLKPGRAHYTALTTPRGTVVDDLLVYQRGEGDYFLVLNAANTPKDVDWLTRHAGEFDVVVRDASAEWAQLAVQGPRAADVLSSLVSADLGAMRYYRFAETDVVGAAGIVSRTGYTGEDGFEIYAPPSEAERLWNAILEAGRPYEIAPIGLGARDTLRLEAKMALYGNDIDDTTTLLEADLGWIVKLDKGPFVGRDALQAQLEQGVTRKLIGFEMLGRGIARHGYEAVHGGEVVGPVTSGSHAPFLKKNIGLAYLPVGLAEIGTEFAVRIRGRDEPARVVPTPFYKRPR